MFSINSGEQFSVFQPEVLVFRPHVELFLCYSRYGLLGIKEVKIRHKLAEKNQPAVKRWRNSLQENRVSDYRASTYEQMTSAFVVV